MSLFPDYKNMSEEQLKEEIEKVRKERSAAGRNIRILWRLGYKCHGREEILEASNRAKHILDRTHDLLKKGLSVEQIAKRLRHGLYHITFVLAHEEDISQW